LTGATARVRFPEPEPPLKDLLRHLKKTDAMKSRCILALDQGTSGTRGTAFNRKGERVGIERRAVRCSFPAPGWVEQDPGELLASIQVVAEELVAQVRGKAWEAVGLGVANQGECLLLWDVETGEPVYPLIGWQCSRSADYCEALRQRGLEGQFRSLTGLPLDPMWPATKIPWVLENVPEAARLLRLGRLAFSQSDSWFLYHLTKEHRFATDHSTAARSGLYSLSSQCWDEDLLQLFGAKGLLMPSIHDSDDDLGTLAIADVEVPWRGNALDQSIALIGQACLRQGQAKVTLGTCAGFWMNIGQVHREPRALDTSVAWQVDGVPTFAIAGESIHAGSLITWISEALGLPWKVEHFSSVAAKARPDDGLVVIPALTGLGAPYWDSKVRGTIFGITSATTQADLVRASLEAVAFSVCDLLTALEELEGRRVEGALRVDGGLSRNEFLLKFLADVLDRPIVRPRELESTLLGTAILAGAGARFYPGIEVANEIWQVHSTYEPNTVRQSAAERYSRWKELVCAARRAY
jgi:glycerol kinase